MLILVQEIGFSQIHCRRTYSMWYMEYLVFTV